MMGRGDVRKKEEEYLSLLFYFTSERIDRILALN